MNQNKDVSYITDKTVINCQITPPACSLQIGMQIRVGDWQLINPSEQTFHPQDHLWLFQHWFDCALDIEEELNASGHRVIW